MEVKINGKIVEVKKGETVLDVAKRCGTEIPTLCYHSDTKIGASCRICVVLVDGKMVTSCSTKVEEGMEIITENEEIEKARKINLELLFSQHQEECNDCVWNMNCKMLDLAKKYNVEINRFFDRKTDYPVYRFGPIEFDSSKCIDCRNCVDICKKQGVEYLEIKEKGHLFKVLPSKKDNKECVYCGQCIIHCPAGAFESVGEFEGIEKPFQDKNKMVIFQIAPSVRSTIGEEFGMPYGEVTTKKLAASLLKIGGDKVFDVSTGADFTTIEESKEFLEKVEKGELPMLTSCCPAWVRFVEFYYPEFIPHLTTVRSPHIILGGIIKKYYAKKENIDLENIVMVSVMPCVAKKHEIERKELKVDGFKPVDYVMTTREVGRILKNKKVDFKKIEEKELDSPFGDSSGSGIAYGSSGGVMQSAYFNISGKCLDFKEVRKGLKVAEVDFNGKKLKLAVVHGLGNAKQVLEELKQDKSTYDYVEAMACYGGCIGGGGQSVPTDEEIRIKRKEGLSKASSEKVIRKASDNLHVKKIYDEIFEEGDIEKLCYTKFYPTKKDEN
jgi:iron-only hydrogenase group A